MVHIRSDDGLQINGGAECKLFVLCGREADVKPWSSKLNYLIISRDTGYITEAGPRPLN